MEILYLKGRVSKERGKKKKKKKRGERGKGRRESQNIRHRGRASTLYNSK
jgi:hypothetical protein